MPKVSVIIPVYGVEKYIERCARSLFGQTLDDIEYLFIDDCTPDRSIEILKEVLEEYPSRKPQVVIHQMEKNSGQAAVRKWGMQNFTGEYVIHCDSDDWIALDMYSVMYKKAKEEDSDIIICDYFRSDGKLSVVVRVKQTKGLLTGPMWNKLVRGCIIKDNDIIYPICNKAEDGALMVQLSYYAKKINSISKPLYYYYQNPDSICHVMTEEAIMRRLNDEIKNTDLRIDFLKKHRDLEKYKHDVLMWKKTCRGNLRPYCYKRKYLILLRNTYPEINKQILLDTHLSIYTKLVFLIEYFGLYNCLLRLKNLIKMVFELI